MLAGIAPSMTGTNDIANSLLELPITVRDYITFCRGRDFVAIQSVSEKLASFESILISDERAVRVVEEGCFIASWLSTLYPRPQALVLGSFARASEYLGGRSIFIGFIPEKDKYIKGAMIPIRYSEMLLIYLPMSTNHPKVLFSPSLGSEVVYDFLLGLNKTWKNEILDALNSELFI